MCERLSCCGRFGMVRVGVSGSLGCVLLFVCVHVVASAFGLAQGCLPAQCCLHKCRRSAPGDWHDIDFRPTNGGGRAMAGYVCAHAILDVEFGVACIVFCRSIVPSSCFWPGAPTCQGVSGAISPSWMHSARAGAHPVFTGCLSSHAFRRRIYSSSLTNMGGSCSRIAGMLG